MDIEKNILIAKGALKHLGFKKFLPAPKTGGTNESRYCYTVWLRHLKNWNKIHANVPETVAELGPGDSLGTGFAALLSGSSHMFAFDVVKYWNDEINLRIFDELVDMFRKKSSLPGKSEYPRVRPEPADFSFPSNILTDAILNDSLSDRRLDRIRKEIQNIDNETNTFIRYKIPWLDMEVLDADSVDLIYSQAVLGCVEELDNMYMAMCRWLKPFGLMSHTIDFKCRLTAEWNGHWKFNDLEWYLIKGGKSYLFNRQPFSKHLKLHRKYGFEIQERQVARKENLLVKTSLAKKFRHLSDEDLSTSGVYLLSSKSTDCSMTHAT